MATAKIALDHYIYEDIYPAFKTATDEKEKTARINRRFLNALAMRKLVLTGSAPLMTADIGSGPCDTLIKYLTGVDFSGGFIIRATDFIPDYADSANGTALHNLLTAQMSGTLKLAGFSVKAGNAFEGRLLDLLSRPTQIEPRHSFRLVFVSHLLYHAEAASDVQGLITDIAQNLLASEGVAILYHLANTPRTFQDFRARFGSQSRGHSLSDTGAVTIDDPPAEIALACRRLGLPLHELEFTTYLHFGPLGNDEWTCFKAPLTYAVLADRNPQAYEDLKRLYFVVQRAPLEFASDPSVTGLSEFIDNIRPVIEEKRGVLPLAERMQVFCKADVPARQCESISDAMMAAGSADQKYD
ncbi:MAG TPA: hypothetical protein VJ728_09380 [Candidatus Binataceae bacterium]|nr:hypothetical protein [Candidatus Binataceae bacterium]